MVEYGTNLKSKTMSYIAMLYIYDSGQVNISTLYMNVQCNKLQQVNNCRYIYQQICPVYNSGGL